MAKEGPEGGITGKNNEGTCNRTGYGRLVAGTKVKTVLIIYSRNGENPWNGGVLEIDNIRKYANGRGEVNLQEYIGKKVIIRLQNGPKFTLDVTEGLQFCTRNTLLGF